VPPTRAIAVELFQGSSGAGTAFPHFFSLQYGCDLTDVTVTRRFALLVKACSENEDPVWKFL